MKNESAVVFTRPDKGYRSHSQRIHSIDALGERFLHSLPMQRKKKTFLQKIIKERLLLSLTKRYKRVFGFGSLQTTFKFNIIACIGKRVRPQLLFSFFFFFFDFERRRRKFTLYLLFSIKVSGENPLARCIYVYVYNNSAQKKIRRRSMNDDSILYSSFYSFMTTKRIQRSPCPLPLQLLLCVVIFNLFMYTRTNKKYLYSNIDAAIYINYWFSSYPAHFSLLSIRWLVM